jgi:hypothetical protein
MSLSPSGSKLAVATGWTKGSSGRVQIYDLGASQMVNLAQPFMTFSTHVIVALDWAPDQKSVAVMSVTFETERWNVAAKTLEVTRQKWTMLGTSPLYPYGG